MVVMGLGTEGFSLRPRGWEVQVGNGPPVSDPWQGLEKSLHRRSGCSARDSTDLLSEVELGEGEGPQVHVLLPDLGLEFLPELVFYDHA